MSISSDEVNFLVFRYLQENGYSHSAFTFAYESLVAKSSIAQAEIPPGALITFLQKGLEYIAIEEHINEDGSIHEFDNNYSLLSPLICEAIAVKEDRRVRKIAPSSIVVAGNGSSSSPMEESIVAGSAIPANTPSTAKLVNETSGSQYLKLSGHLGEVFMCLWSPSTNQLSSGSADGTCRLWSLNELSRENWASTEPDVHLSTAILPHSTCHGEKYKDVTSVTWSPDGKFLATGCYDGVVRIWDNNGKQHMQLEEHTGPVFSLKWGKKGTYILSGSYDRRAIVWSAHSGKVVKTFMLHSGPVLDVDWKDDEQDLFATCSSDRSIHICQASSKESNKAVRTFSGHEDEVNAVCWSPGGAMLASCSDDTTAKIWTIEQGLVFDLKGHAKEIFTLRWTPTGPNSFNADKKLLLCTASFDGTVKVWSGSTGLLVFNLCKQVQPVYSLAPSPDGNFIATGSLGGNVSIWSLKEGELVKEAQGAGDTFDVSWSQDGTLLCACFSSGTLYILDTQS
jgi:transducin (beta)-like 1